ncbi:MAG: flippase-like domain-containing protein [Candidatus Omnitrophica bacterium]|nr:flippase-like domain-containing protein [Candidatus Omnitrophota bacterium]
MVDKKTISICLRFIVSFGLLATLLWIMRKDIESISSILKNCNKAFLIIALVINIAPTILMGLRLKLLLKGQKISMGMKDVMYLTFIGFFFNNFLPTAIGGDIAKAYYTSKKTNNKLGSYAAVLSDRLFGLIATTFIAVIGMVFIGRTLNNNALFYGILIVFIASIAIIFFLFNIKAEDQAFSGTGIMNKIKNKIYQLYSAINLYRNHKLLMTRIALLSILIQCCAIVTIYFFVLSIGGSIPLLKLFLIIPMVWAVSMAPSINGLGVREGAFMYFLKGDIGTERAFAISLLWLGVIILYSIAGGILHLMYPVNTRKLFRDDF